MEWSISRVKDILTLVLLISSVTVLLFSLFVWVVSPRFEPYLDLPSRLTGIEAAVSLIVQPSLIEFRGSGHLVDQKDSYKRGEVILVRYLLKRVASCDTKIRIRFYNTVSGAYFQGPLIDASKAPVTTTFSNFRLNIKVPDDLPNGEWTYHPVIIPIECGLYNGEFVPPHTDAFIVKGTKTDE
tara:strand:- start:3354 stop:3902 length:549 start_codon:yes stop_codon:yes gene_type:complete